MQRLVAIALSIVSSAISSQVLAQSRSNSDRFIDVGSGQVILLDKNSVTNNRFQLVLQSGDGGYQVEQYQIACNKKAYILLNVRMYDSNDKLITFLNEPSNPMVYSANSPVGRSAAIVCQNR